MRLSPEEKALCKTNLKFFTEASKTGKDFVDLCRKIIVRHKLDVLVADPLLSYVGGDLSKQEVCSHFLRNLVQPVLQETGCIMVFIHHEGKPKPQETKDAQTVSDQMYSGIGSSELVNWARAIINIRRESKELPVFSFNLTKRGKLAGMRTPDGKPTLSIKLKHADDRVLWEVAPLAGGFELLKVGQQYRHFESKPRISRGALLEELVSDHKLQRDQAEALLKALVTNGIMEPRKVGAALYYQGTKYEA
jgi:hypothetical protein